jgi:hypothetical protein
MCQHQYWKGGREGQRRKTWERKIKEEKFNCDYFHHVVKNLILLGVRIS